jgi:hypothetical protein
MGCLRKGGAILRFELQGRRHLAGLPGRHQAGEHAGHDRQAEGGQQHQRIQVHEVGVAHRLLAHRPQAQVRQAQPEHAAGQADGAGFDQALREDRAARRTQRATDADLAGATQELRQQQAHGVEQAHQQEAERQPDLQAHVARYHPLVVQPFHQPAQADVGGALEAAGGALLVGIVGQVLAVGRDLFRAAELDPVLQPTAGRVDAGLAFGIVAFVVVAPAVHAAVAVELEVARGRERHVRLLGLAVAVGVEVVELRRRAPVAEHADHAEIVAGQPHRLADAVAAAEQLVVELLRQHHHPAATRVLVGAPAVAVQERRANIGKKSAVV